MCYNRNMKIAILGLGKEGQSAEKYFQNHDLQIFDNFTPEEISQQDFSEFDLVLRSPSLRPQAGWSSMTRYFFDHCPCPIIGVTGTKGKGTTCSLIIALLKVLGRKVWLVGNIGTPALDVLDKIQKNDIVVYEMSSFQLWDLEKSPHVAVILPIEPDHLNIHADYTDYVAAKANIAQHQTSTDFCIYNQKDPDATTVALQSAGTKIPYPATANRTELDSILDSLIIPGQHNRENAEAALRAVAAYLDQDLQTLLTQKSATIRTAFANFQGLPHRIQFLRELNGVKYYDDNFSSAFPALDVALATFPNQPIVLIAGGKDRGIDPTPAKQRLFHTPNLEKIFLIGETSNLLAAGEDPAKYQFCSTLPEAFTAARQLAENIAATSSQSVVLLMSPGAPSFDMFQNFVDRGNQFQKLVQEAH